MRGFVSHVAQAAALVAAVCVSFAAPAPPPTANGAKCAVIWDDRSGGSASKFSKSRAENVTSLLSQGGISAPVRPMSEMASAAGSGKVLHLVLPDGASAADRKTLDSFARRGGKVVVHGSFSPVVSDFFGLEKHGPEYVKPKSGSAWTGYRIQPPRPLNAPEKIDNRTPIATERTPAKGRGVTVLARWESERGESGPAAILRSPVGFWLSRPLYDDGPAARRSELLVALTCALAPELWRDATPALERAAWSDAAPDAGGSFASAEAAVRAAAPRSRKALVSTLLDAARARYDAAETLCHQGLYGAARENAVEMASSFVRAAAAARPLTADRKKKPLAVWTASARPPASAGSWEKAAGTLARAGVTDVMVFAGSLACSPTQLPGVPRDTVSAPSGDPFADAVAACHAAGLRVHAWFPALRFEGAPQERFDAYEKSRRLLHSPEGKALPWLDPAVAANRTEIASALAALVKRTRLDGVNLDFIRYPDAATREKRSPAAIDSTVRAVREALSVVSPKCKLSASVYGGIQSASVRSRRTGQSGSTPNSSILPCR